MIPIDSTSPPDMHCIGVAFVGETAHVSCATPLTLAGAPHGVDLASVKREGNSLAFPAPGYYRLDAYARRFIVAVFPLEALAAAPLARRAHGGAPRRREEIELILTAVARTNEPLDQLTPQRPVPAVQWHQFGGDYQ